MSIGSRSSPATASARRSARGHPRARGGGPPLRDRLRVDALRLELRDLRADRPHDAGGRHRRSCGRFDAIYLGAVGFPGVPDHVSLWGLLIPIRREFHQYVNLRPVRLLPGVRSPLAGRGPADIDLLIVRENNEGEYSEIGGRLYRGTPRRWPSSSRSSPGTGCDRVMRYAFELAKKRPRQARDLGHQVERHHPHHAVLGRALRGDGRGVSRTSRPTSTTSTSSPPISSSTPTGSTSWSPRTSSATSCPTWARRSRARSASPPRPTSTPSGSTRRCSSRCTARPPTSPARASPTRSARSGRAR